MLLRSLCFSLSVEFSLHYNRHTTRVAELSSVCLVPRELFMW